MYIFIDETGAFQTPTRSQRISAVAALVIPESFAKTLFRRFRALVGLWRNGNSEVKGSALVESQMAEVVRTITRFEVLLLVVAIDMSLHTAAGIEAHRDEQASKVRDAAARMLRPELKARLDTLADQLGRLSVQLYAQSMVLTSLLQAVLEASTLYYVQRNPKTLGSFTWRIDAKDVRVTPYEQLWQQVVGPLLQTRSLSTPLLQLEGADYSAFNRFCGEYAEAPAHLRSRVAESTEPFLYVNHNELLRDLRFSASHRVTGLQMVDILAAGVRRALNNTLGRAGWNGLGRLMPHAPRGLDCVRFLALEDLPDVEVPYAGIVREWNRVTRRMVV